MGRVLVQLPGTTTAKAITETLSKNVIIVDEDLHQLRLHDGSTAGGHLIGNSAGSGVPVGTIIPFAGNSVPQGYLLCDGSAISRTTYAPLFAVIGTIYGAGDGSTTFNLPGVLSRNTLVQSGSNQILGARSTGGVPNITGSDAISWSGRYAGFLNNGASQTGCFLSPDTVASPPYYFAYPGAQQVSGNHPCGIKLDASHSSSVYGNTTSSVCPASLAIQFCIKY